MSLHLADDLSGRVPRANQSSEFVLEISLHLFRLTQPITSLSLWMIQMFQLKGSIFHLLAQLSLYAD